jgi:CRP-like cAMP-binding protein
MRLRPDRDAGLPRLQTLTLFSRSSNQELRRVSALTTEVEIETGRRLVDPQRWERQVFVIAEGTAEIRIGTRVLAHLKPGAVFGEIAVRPPVEPIATVAAATPMIVFVLTDLEWRSLPEHLRVAADRLRLESARLLREAKPLDGAADEDLSTIDAGTGDARSLTPAARRASLSLHGVRHPLRTLSSRKA